MTESSAQESAIPAGKGKPTPKRREAEAKNKRPLVQGDRKAAARENRRKAADARAKTQQAYLTGDERYLPPRDKGPVRRYVRDYIDARWNLGEFFLPASLVIVVVILVGGRWAQQSIYVILALYFLVLLAMADAIVTSFILRRRLNEKFGAENVPRGTIFYGVMRAFQIRRSRLPRPQVKRGEYPI